MRSDGFKRPGADAQDPPEDTADTRPRSVELRLVFPCAPMSVRHALHNTMSGLGAMGLGEDDSSTVELVLAEVLNNIAEHAYRDDPDGLIDLFLSQSPDGLTCRVVDRGTPMPGMHPPLALRPSPACALDAYPEGGFGWFLIHSLTRNLNYMRDRNRNILTFAIDVRHPLRRN